jgi:hypothetical protein
MEMSRGDAIAIWFTVLAFGFFFEMNYAMGADAHLSVRNGAESAAIIGGIFWALVKLTSFAFRPR